MGILDDALLNEPQRMAVRTIEGPVLIIAGAGSGKTRVITYRIAHMFERGIPQSAILALTFTNKAAREMVDRIRALTKKKLANLTASTFHAFGVQILKHGIHRLGYRPNFSIYDEVDRQSLIRTLSQDLGFPREKVNPYQLTGVFSAIKNGTSTWTETTSMYQPLYEECERHLKLYNAVDFDDLILLPARLFREHPDFLEEFSARFKYILVDEFQDTSLVQYELLKQLGGKHQNVCVVGDDDQSIYSWRGADYRNIRSFEADFPNRLEIKLEQNYRSTGIILDAANRLIAHNTDRKGKVLWTGEKGGRPIRLLYPDGEKDEALFIARKIREIHRSENVKYEDFGVLVRTNSLTRSLEEAFLIEKIPYKVSGGMSFFQRKEVKDVLSYLRVLSNPEDDVNILRILNTPRRGIGAKTLEQLNKIAAAKRASLYSAMCVSRAAADSPLPDKAQVEVNEFLSLVEFYREKMLTGKKMAETLEGLITQINYWGHLLLEHKDEKAARWKWTNVQSLIAGLDEYEKDPDIFEPSLASYLNRIALLTRDDREDEEGKVNLMTIHAAKGLEFHTVFIAGVEQGIIPHARSVDEGGNPEEERRLFYVAITRARVNLFMTSARSRRIGRDLMPCVPSPFLEEIPPEYIEAVIEETPQAREEAFKAFGDLAKKMSQGD